MLKILLTIILLLSLVGCTQVVWVHPDKTQADFERDKLECLYEVEMHVQFPMYGGMAEMFQYGMIRNQMVAHCMELRGYRQQRQSY